jgi:hypothetical protein
MTVLPFINTLKHKTSKLQVIVVVVVVVVVVKIVHPCFDQTRIYSGVYFYNTYPPTDGSDSHLQGRAS